MSGPVSHLEHSRVWSLQKTGLDLVPHFGTEKWLMDSWTIKVNLIMRYKMALLCKIMTGLRCMYQRWDDCYPGIGIDPFLCLMKLELNRLHNFMLESELESKVPQSSHHWYIHCIHCDTVKMLPTLWEVSRKCWYHIKLHFSPCKVCALICVVHVLSRFIHTIQRTRTRSIHKQKCDGPEVILFKYRVFQGITCIGMCQLLAPPPPLVARKSQLTSKYFEFWPTSVFQRKSVPPA